MHRSKCIERIHLKFCKQILHVKSSTNHVAVYSELGRLPMYLNQLIRVVKFWLKLIDSKNCILQNVYQYLCDECLNGVQIGHFMSNLFKNHLALMRRGSTRIR